MDLDYYKVLGVDKNASQDEIKKAFRKLSLKNHPDKGGDAKKFKEINEAYQNIGDPDKRKQYDMKGQMPSGFPFTGGFGGGGQPDMNGMGIPPEILKAMFGGGMPMNFGFSQNGMPNIQIFRNGVNVTQNNMRKPAQIIQNVTITLEQAYNGMKMPLEIERWVLEENVKRVEKETVYIDIPQGIDNNEIIMLKEKGNIMSESNKGDIKVFVNVKNDSDFERNGINLVLKKKITLKESLCGFMFEIKYFNDRKFNIKNYNNVIKPGYAKVVPNLGLTRDNHTGNLIIIFDVEFPEEISSDNIEKLKNIL